MSSPTFAQTIQLNGIRLLSISEVNPTPVMVRKKRLKQHVTRPGQNNTAGNRTFMDLGSNVSWSDIEFEIPYLTNDQHLALEAHFSGTTMAVYSPDDGITFYGCRWTEDGYAPENYLNNGNIFKKAKIKLAIQYKMA